MNFVKVKFLKDGQPSGREYTYKTELELKTGDVVELPSGNRGVVVRGEIDTMWVESFGMDNIKEITSKTEIFESYRIIDIIGIKENKTRVDGRYPLRIGRTCKKPEPIVGKSMYLEYLKDVDGSDYKKFLMTSLVTDFTENDGIIKVRTLNSEYVFEEIKENGGN